nr:Colicin-Ia [Pseudomonas fluorescens]
MAAFEKYKDALNKKFSVKDRQAIAKALDSLNKEQMAKNLKQFSKAFGYVGKAIDYADLLTEIKKSYTTGEWSNTFLKVETLFAGSAASALLAVVFGAAASTAMGAVAFALLMAMTGAYIDEALVKKFNDAVIAL